MKKQREFAYLNDPNVLMQVPLGPHRFHFSAHSSISISQLTPSNPVLLQRHR